MTLLGNCVALEILKRPTATRMFGSTRWYWLPNFGPFSALLDLHCCYLQMILYSLREKHIVFAVWQG